MRVRPRGAGAGPTTAEEAHRHCRLVARREARNFYYAFITLPPGQRAGIYATYAFCRLCDDAADSRELSPTARSGALADLREQVNATYGGRPSGPVFTALLDVARSFQVPPEMFHEIIDGVEMDLTTRRFPTFAELRRYCYGVASTVGLVCIQIFGYRDERAREHAIDLGVAMQLANILRDLREDAQRDRVYLPLEDLERFGYSEADLQARQANAHFQELMAFQLRRARAYFDRGAMLLPLLPARSRACVAVLHGLYSRILDRIAARPERVFQERVGLGTPAKLALTARFWSGSLLGAAYHRRWPA